jgi:hypothetical protein
MGIAALHPSYEISNTTSHSRGAMRPEFCWNLALEKQRARGRPGARCTRGLACDLHQKVCTRAYRFSGEHPASPTQWLYDLYVIVLVTGFLATIIAKKR